MPSSSTRGPPPRCGRPVPHGHPDVGVLQCQRVVHAVAGHRHHATAALQRGDHGPLLVRAHPTEDASLLQQVRQRPPAHWGARVRRRRPSPPARPGLPPSQPPSPRSAVVAGEHLQRDALLGEVAQHPRRPSDPLDEHHQGDGDQSAGSCGLPRRSSARPCGPAVEPASPRRPAVGGSRPRSGRRRGAPSPARPGPRSIVLWVQR